jgi:hypothetical protein
MQRQLKQRLLIERNGRIALPIVSFEVHKSIDRYNSIPETEDIDSGE